MAFAIAAIRRLAAPLSDRTRFTYSADGAPYMKIAPDGAVTVYLGQYFEVEISGGSAVTTSYCNHAGRRVAMRGDSTVYYLYGDCRGSAPHALPFR